MLLQEAILQKETMRKAGDWQQVKAIEWGNWNYAIGNKKNRQESEAYIFIVLKGERFIRSLQRTEDDKMKYHGNVAYMILF